MKEALIRVKCDRCRNVLDEDEDDITESLIEVWGKRFELDLCKDCNNAVYEFFSSWLPTPVNNRCPDCHKTFSSWQAVSTHRARKHGYLSDEPAAVKQRQRRGPKPKGPFICPECQKEMDSAQQLGTHRWSAHRQRAGT